MKALRYYAAVMTDIAAGLAIASGMWIWTRADVLEIFLIVVMFTAFPGLLVMELTDPESPLREILKGGRHAGKAR